MNPYFSPLAKGIIAGQIVSFTFGKVKEKL